MICIVDDDITILNKLEEILTKQKYVVKTFQKPEIFFEEIQQNTPKLVITDIIFKNSSLTGEDVVIKVNEERPETQIIVMSGESDINRTLNCMKQGALDFIEKPLSLSRLLTSVKNAINLYDIKNSLRSSYIMLGHSKVIRETIKKLQKLAKLNESVLITGESGTGKEMAARTLHHYSNRFMQPLSMINCTALNPSIIESELFGHLKGSFTGALTDKVGYFEKTTNSSLLIDEIGDLPLEIQVKLLRVIQEKNITPVGSHQEIDIDTRMIFATHRDLNEMISQHTFREDLYFRISTFTVHIPPLRERLEDIEILANHFLNSFTSENGLNPLNISESALDKLMSYNYPGNIRELSQIIKNAAFFTDGDFITPEDINFTQSSTKSDIWDDTKELTLSEAKAHFEKELINRRLKSFNSHIESTANSLGLIKNNLYRKLKSYDINYQK